MASPLAVHAQRNAMPVIGYLHFASPNYIPAPESFLLGLKDYGYVDGQNIALEYRRAQGEYDRLPAMAAELVARGAISLPLSVRRRPRRPRMRHPRFRSYSRSATTPWKPDW